MCNLASSSRIPLYVLIALSIVLPCRAQVRKPAAKQPAAAAQKSQQATANEAQKRFDRALELAQKGKYDEAIAEMQAVKKLIPDQPAVYINLGRFHMQKQSYGNAEFAFRQALALGSKDPSVYAQLARLLMAKDNNTEALDMAKKAAKADPKDFGSRYLLGVLYLRLDKYAEAVPEFKAALAIKPGDDGSLYNLAYCQYNLKQYIETRKTLLEYFKNNPNDAQARVMAGAAHEQSGDEKGAIPHYEKAAWLKEPASRSAILNLVRLYDKLEQPDKGLATLKKAAASMPDDYDVQFALGQAYYTKGDYKDAEPAFLAARKVQSDLGVNLYLALNYLNQNQTDPAEASARAAINLDPKDKQALEVYAYVLDRIGKHDEAVAQYRKWEKYYPDDTAPNLKLANIFQARNENNLAVAEYQKAMEKQAGDSALMIGAASAMRSAGKLDDAVALLTRVIAAELQNETAYMALAGLYEQQQKTDLAIDQYNKILSFNDKSLVAMQRLAVAYDSKEDYLSEIAVYRKMLVANPADTRSAMMIPRLYEKAGQLDDALQESSKLVDANPADTNMRTQYGDLLGRTGDWQSAIEQYDELVKSQDTQATSHGYYLKGNALEKLEKTDDAILSYKKCLESAPSTAEALDALSAIYKSRDKQDEFLAYLGMLIDSGADNAPYAYYINAYNKAGKAAQATTTLEQLAEKHPDSASVSTALAGCYKDSGAVDKAISIYVGLIDKNKNDTTARRGLGDIYAQMGKDDQAAEQYSEILKTWPFDPVLQQKLGDVYVKLGKKEEAIAAYQQALQMNPSDQETSAKLKDLENPVKADDAKPEAQPSDSENSAKE